MAKIHTILMVSVIVGIAVIMIGMTPAMALPIPELDELPEDKKEEICAKLIAAKEKGAKIPIAIMEKLCG